MNVNVIEIPTQWSKEGTEFYCDHIDTRVETTETWPTNPMDNGHEIRIYVCNDCDETVDGDPDYDRAEYLAEQQIDEMRGK